MNAEHFGSVIGQGSKVDVERGGVTLVVGQGRHERGSFEWVLPRDVELDRSPFCIR